MKSTNQHVTVIQPSKSLYFSWRELLRSKSLLYFFVWRNFKIRYKQTVIGAAWAVLQPLILMVVFTIFFNRIAGIGSGSSDVPYPIFAFIGLMFWAYFSQGLTQVSQSLLTYQNVIKKIYFPRIIAPVSSALTGLIDMGFTLLIYIILMFVYQIVPSFLGVVLFIPMVFLSVMTVVGLGTLLAAINLKYRDVQQALPFFIQTFIFLTPVIYPVSLVPDSFSWLLFLNPIAGVIETMRASLLGIGEIPWMGLGISITSAIVLVVVGLKYFYAKEREFADLV